MAYSRTYTPNNVGNLTFVVVMVGGNSLTEEFAYEDFNPGTQTVIGAKDFTGWSSFSMVFAKDAESAPVLTKTWTASEAIVGAASAGTILVFLTDSDTALVQTSGLRQGFCAISGVDPAGNTMPLERGRWHLDPRPV